MKIKDRLVLQSVLPTQGNFVTMQMALEIKDRIAPKAEEFNELEFKFDDKGNANWNTEKDVDRDYNFSPSEVALIQKSLKDMETSQKLTADHISLYKTFVLQDNKQPEKTDG